MRIMDNIGMTDPNIFQASLVSKETYLSQMIADREQVESLIMKFCPALSTIRNIKQWSGETRNEKYYNSFTMLLYLFSM